MPQASAVTTSFHRVGGGIELLPLPMANPRVGNLNLSLPPDLLVRCERNPAKGVQVQPLQQLYRQQRPHCGAGPAKGIQAKGGLSYWGPGPPWPQGPKSFIPKSQFLL